MCLEQLLSDLSHQRVFGAVGVQSVTAVCACTTVVQSVTAVCLEQLLCSLLQQCVLGAVVVLSVTAACAWNNCCVVCYSSETVNSCCAVCTAACAWNSRCAVCWFKQSLLTFTKIWTIKIIVRALNKLGL